MTIIEELAVNFLKTATTNNTALSEWCDFILTDENYVILPQELTLQNTAQERAIFILASCLVIYRRHRKTDFDREAEHKLAQAIFCFHQAILKERE